MNEEQEKKLVDILLSKQTIIWIPDSGTAKKVLRIAKPCDEPSLCAYFSFGYAALYNCDLSDFYIAHPIQ